MIQITFSSRSNNTKCCSKHRTAKNFRVHIQPVFGKSLTKGIRDTTVKGYNQNPETSTGGLASGFLDVAGSGCMSIGSSESTHVRYTGVIQMEPLCCPLNGAHRHTTAAERPRISGSEQSRADRQRTRGQRAPTTPERSSSSRRQRTNWFSRRQRPNCRTISTFVKCRRRRAVGAGARSETPQRRELKAELGGRRVWKQG